MVKCEVCGTENVTNSNYCQSCGSKLNINTKCRFCKTENPITSEYCKNCGKSLKKPSSASKMVGLITTAVFTIIGLGLGTVLFPIIGTILGGAAFFYIGAQVGAGFGYSLDKKRGHFSK